MVCLSRLNISPAMKFHFDKRTILLTGLSLSIGWGIRGNFGHEFGAMIPGALAAMAAVLAINRDDWQRRIAYFAMFGALGWSFGGSISYMQVIGYTHSGHSPSQLYGFASLFLSGFLWAAMGGAGTALPAVLDRERLTEFFAPLIAVFVAWLLQDGFERWLVTVDSAYRQESPLYWYDSDWLAAATAIVAVLALAAARRRLDEASKLILHMAVGWWVAFVLLVPVLGLRMTPPRGDNWAGCVGMVAGMLIYFERRKLRELTLASLVCGFIGGAGFASGQLTKLMWIKTGWQTNWHSVLEQSYGFINGIGVAVALLLLAARTPRASDEPADRKWTEIFAVCFVLLGVTWLNLSRNPETWVKAKTVPAVMAGLSAQAWFDLAYAAMAAIIIWLMLRHRRQPLEFIPSSGLGRGQLFYLVFLWWMVIGNFERAVVAFTAQRLITEGVIFLNAGLCTLILLSGWPVPVAAVEPKTDPIGFGVLLKRAVAAGLICAALSLVADWGITRAMYGDQQAAGAAKHIRFGPNATAVAEKPKAGQPHP
jgi:hypothetical protein